MCPASLSLPQSGCYCGGDVQDAALLSDKNGKGQECPGMKRSDVITGMLRPVPGRLTATHTRAAIVAMASHMTHHNRATSSSPSQAVVLLCTLKKISGKCFAKYATLLGIWLACCAVERKNPQCQQNLNTAWVHSACRGEPSLLTNPPEQFWHPLHRDCRSSHSTVHFEDRNRNINLFTLREKKEHCQHVFSVFTRKEKKTQNKNQRQIVNSADNQCSCEITLLYEPQKCTKGI